MGVQGLASLIDRNQKIYRDLKFRRRRLVIDGLNFLYLLYFDSGLDLIRGGEYAAFEELVERFIKALKDCSISPFMVLDGGSDVTHKKDETVRLRVVQRIEKANRAAEESKQEKILPQLAKHVFNQTLARLGVPTAVCYGEADQEIAALAKEWECPVLSNDSDFYIFDLPGGLLPISHFQWQAVQGTGSQSYIPCKIYRSSSFCIAFEIKPQLLPAFAVLAGNDYAKLERMESSISWTQFAQTVNGAQPHHLEGLLCWMRGFGKPEEAFEAALGLMGKLNKERRAEVREYLTQGMEEYRLRSSSLKRFFIHGVAPPFPPVKETPTCPVPDWALLPLTQARLTADILDLLLLHSAHLSCPVDLKDKPSANQTSRPIRQVIYWLLLGGEEVQVLESDRDGLELKSFSVKPAASGVARTLQLQSLDQVEPSVGLQVLLETLGVSEDSLGELQPHLRLLVAATCYWLQRAEPPPDQTLLKALLLGVSHGAALRQRAASEKQIYKQKLDPDVSHAFNQWQGCLKHSIHLNQLLGRPLLEPTVARCYEGSLVHRLVHMMRTDQKLKTFLKSAPSTMTEYHSMLAVTRQFQSTLPRPARHKPDVRDLKVTLKELFDLYEEEEVGSAVRAHEDLCLDDLLSVKTRYRAKERSSRCDSLMLTRKQECRSWDML
ncbi:single-strand DNA endonuclease ASTE1 [Halichoeres trimaculatus]|uniref:single-strand DNA endonuclease ASTE1 n=1 Tax=Halichoeres trimaculatus TaxID=147232 RepID=UPI003D9E5FBA